MSKFAALSLAMVMAISLFAQNAGPRHAPVAPAAMGPHRLRLQGLGEPGTRTLYPSLGAVVVVEEEPVSWVTLVPKRTGLRRFFTPAPLPAGGLPAPCWMEDAKVVSGGNTIAQLVPLGWGY